MPISITAELNSPFYQRVGENLHKVNLETTGTQVKLTKQNGVTQDDVQKELEALHTALDGAASGDVVGPASAVDGNLAAFDQTTGKLLKDSTLPLSDAADAVSKRHEHANQTDVLDKLGTSDGKLTFDGQAVGDGLRDIMAVDSLENMPPELRDGGFLVAPVVAG